jgi:C4-dicarboxylate-specific signal transduction histidine kinase
MTDSVTSCNLSQVVTDLRKLLEPQRSFKEIDLQIDVPDSLRIPMAPQRLLQVLLNLTMNAADALSDTPSPRTIRLEAALENGQTNVWVIDNGPGVPDALRARIFDPFVTTKEVGAGTGLGLPVCLGLVESAGGTLELSRRKAEPNTSGATAKGGAPNTSGATAKGGAPNTSGAEFVLRFPTVRASRFE